MLQRLTRCTEGERINNTPREKQGRPGKVTQLENWKGHVTFRHNTERGRKDPVIEWIIYSERLVERIKTSPRFQSGGRGS